MIWEKSGLRDRLRVFRDRREGGLALREILEPRLREVPMILAIPSGGVPVAAGLAEGTDWPVEAAVVSKITLPSNTEAGYGAVAFDGTVRLNEALLPSLGLSLKEIQRGIERTRDKVARRQQRLYGGRPFPEIGQRTVVLVDDGLASGFTMQVAIEAVSGLGARKVIVAAPTGHARTVERIAERVEAVCCPNIRGGWRFAVAEAYEQWRDVSEEEALRALNEIWARAD